MRLRFAVLFCVLTACSDPTTFDAGTDVPTDNGSAEASLDAGDASDGSIDAADVHDEDALEGPDVPRDVPPVDMGNCDEDGDGHRATACGGDDCDDHAADVHPGAFEVCNGIDENCDGVADALPDGGFDPAADMQCAARFTMSGAVTSPTHCYLRPQRTPCGAFPSLLPDGVCFGCWRPAGSTTGSTCQGWCDGTVECGTGMCPQM